MEDLAMSVESNVNFIPELNDQFPRKNDLIKEGDDHIRLVKKVLKNTLPGFNKALTITADSMNNFDRNVGFETDTVILKGAMRVDGSINVNGKKLTGLATPTADGDAVSWKFVKDLTTAIYNTTWPINSIYFTVDDRNPSVILGFGTWEKFGQGRVPVGTGTGVDVRNESKTFVNSGVGGNYSSVLTIDNLPSHTHQLSLDTTSGGEHRHDGGVAIRASSSQPFGKAVAHEELFSYEHHKYGEDIGTAWTSTVIGHTHSIQGNTVATGSGFGFNTQNPYIGVSMWKRTA
ncbi:putative collar domain containing protein/baseplate wedge protein [Aeromonas phage LAh_9]|uniref:Putative collar domain containing protein/baseplate wedge protein n=1 Tax=Aeromonas phage LAh_9 TaxID=2591033 RepID=A0A514A0T3_9CAUD|nr:tail protein [Aeromonas phage LAh_9]QDH46888.1 putative collar domain containing protein/baseplate wedge protein [Aeromonas phage LAh_9]